MVYKSIISDEEIAEVLSLDIVYGIKDINKQIKALQELRDGLDGKIATFGVDFESALGDDVRQLLEESEDLVEETKQVKFIEDLVGKGVYNIIHEEIKELSSKGNLRTKTYEYIVPYSHNQGNGLVEVGAEVWIYNGTWTQKGQILTDYKSIARIFKNLKTIRFGYRTNESGPDIVFSMWRVQDPEFVELRSDEKTEFEKKLPCTHRIGAIYASIFPTVELSEIYNRLAPNSAH